MKKLSKKSKLHGRIHIEHVEAACDWAKKARKSKKPSKIDGVERLFDMRQYDFKPVDGAPTCGSACCIFGAAALLAGHSGKRFTNRGIDVEFDVVLTSPADRAAEVARWELLSSDGSFASDAERDLFAATEAAISESEAPEMALAACAAIRKERGLPPRKKARRKESSNAS